jgi:hypothetical protein
MVNMKKKKILFVLLPTVFVIVLSSVYIKLLKPNQFNENIPSPTVTITPGIENKETTLPEIFPNDFPQYPEAVITSSWAATNSLTDGFSVVWETNDDPVEVKAYYLNNLVKNNWQIKEPTPGDSDSIITFQKGQTSGFIGITKGTGNKTVISVTMGIEK